MKRLTQHSLLLLLLLALIGCKKSAPTSEGANDNAAEEEAQAQEQDDGPVDTTPLKAEFDAELLYSFEGVMGEGGKHRPEDHTPVQHHEGDLEEGDYIYVEMQAHDPFRTYLLIATPNRTGGYQNGECYPGQGLSSCVRFQADQSGTYLFMANAATTRSRGAYTLNVYKETEEQAKANAEAHARVAEESRKRLEQHLRTRDRERAQERKKTRERIRSQRKEKAKGETPDVNDVDDKDTPSPEDDTPAQEDATP